MAQTPSPSCRSPSLLDNHSKRSFPRIDRVSYGTYTRELDATVTALGGSATLLDVKDTEVAAGGLDQTCPVGRRVVAAVMIPPSATLLFALSRHDLFPPRARSSPRSPLPPGGSPILNSSSVSRRASIGPWRLAVHTTFRSIVWFGIEKTHGLRRR